MSRCYPYPPPGYQKEAQQPEVSAAAPKVCPTAELFDDFSVAFDRLFSGFKDSFGFDATVLPSVFRFQKLASGPRLPRLILVIFLTRDDFLSHD